jgi:hypothetical protein
MPIATKIGRKQRETKIPATTHINQTGKFAPATLITGSHPLRSRVKIQKIGLIRTQTNPRMVRERE